FFLRASACEFLTRNHRTYPRIYDTSRAGAESGRANERAVRDSARYGIRFGSESTGFAHGSIREQGDWSTARKSRSAFDDREKISRHESSNRATQRRCGNRSARILFREVAGRSVQYVSWCGYDPWPRVVFELCCLDNLDFFR